MNTTATDAVYRCHRELGDCYNNVFVKGGGVGWCNIGNKTPIRLLVHHYCSWTAAAVVTAYSLNSPHYQWWVVMQCIRVLLIFGSIYTSAINESVLFSAVTMVKMLAITCWMTRLCWRWKLILPFAIYRKWWHKYYVFYKTPSERIDND